MTTKTKAIFIVGHPRSGSTLLASLLGEHSNIAAMPETHIIRSSLYAGSPIQRLLAKTNIKSRISLMFENVRLHDLNIEQDEFLRFCTKHNIRSNSNSDILKAFINYYQTISTKPITLEKTPGHIAYAKQILTWLPDAKLIYTVRDARPTVESLMRAVWTHSNPRRHAAYWSWCVRQATKTKKLHGNRTFIVKYEHLVREPYDTIKELCAFMNIDYEPPRPTDTRSNIVVPSWEADWKENSRRDIDPAHADKWRDSIDPTLQTLVEQCCHDELKALGYIAADAPRPKGLLHFTKIWHDRIQAEFGIFYRERFSSNKNRFRKRMLSTRNRG